MPSSIDFQVFKCKSLLAIDSTAKHSEYNIIGTSVSEINELLKQKVALLLRFQKPSIN